MSKTFIQFLREQHAKHYFGTDDNMPAAFQEWLYELSFDELHDYADFAYNEGVPVENIFKVD